jgi:hypothetical protein
LLALTEINGGGVIEEMLYAASGLERMLKRRIRGDRYGSRQRALAKKILEVL